MPTTWTVALKQAHPLIGIMWVTFGHLRPFGTT